MRHTSGYERVYAIRNPANGHIKIGHAADPQERLEQGRCWVPDAHILAIGPGGPEREHHLHRKLAEHRVDPNREWFRPHDEVMVEVERLPLPWTGGRWRRAPYDYDVTVRLPSGIYHALDERLRQENLCDLSDMMLQCLAAFVIGQISGDVALTSAHEIELDGRLRRLVDILDVFGCTWPPTKRRDATAKRAALAEEWPELHSAIDDAIAVP